MATFIIFFLKSPLHINKKKTILRLIFLLSSRTDGQKSVTCTYWINYYKELIFDVQNLSWFHCITLKKKNSLSFSDVIFSTLSFFLCYVWIGLKCRKTHQVWDVFLKSTHGCILVSEIRNSKLGKHRRVGAVHLATSLPAWRRHVLQSNSIRMGRRKLLQKRHSQSLTWTVHLISQHRWRTQPF